MSRNAFPRLPPRRLVLLGAGGAAVALAALLALTDVWSWPTALVVAAIALVAILQAVLLVHVRRLHEAVHRIQVGLAAHEEQASQVRPLIRQLGTAAEQDRSEVAIALDQIGLQTRRGFRRVNSRLQRQAGEFSQIEALLDLHSMLRPAVSVPSSRGWAASPTTLRALVAAVLDSAPKVVVECGSGASSVWIGLALRRLGAGRCITLEHDEKFAREARVEVARHGLQDIVDVRLAPLVDVGDPDGRPWYTVEQISDVYEVGLVFVDGPPGAVAPQARYPAVPLLRDRCLPDALFLLDDAARQDERAVVERWIAEHDLRSVRSSPSEKGWHLLALPGAHDDVAE